MHFKFNKFYLFIGALVLVAIIVPTTVVPTIISLHSAASAPSSAASYSTLWSNGFDINTDWETSWPDTGVTRVVRSSASFCISSSLTHSPQYTWTLAEADQYTGGDGGAKEKAMLINGTFRSETACGPPAHRAMLTSS